MTPKMGWLASATRSTGGPGHCCSPPAPTNGQEVDLDPTTDTYTQGVAQIRHGYLLGGGQAVGRRADDQLDRPVRS